MKIKSDKIFFYFGLLLLLISLFLTYKTSYHVIFYDKTLGYDRFTLGYGKPFEEILINFIYSVSLFISSFGLISKNIIGRRITFFFLIPPVLYSLLYLLAVLPKVYETSYFIYESNIESVFNIINSLNYPYLEPFIIFLIIPILFIEYKMILSGIFKKLES
ncbi:hypothetical protein [Aureibacter tunicatorum]|uniref:Uncharacterized protein n=1 Tax=Aureibacter tunicatorum TaxID=866807 RepID=A0AAE3XP83_9BACT|nr:hypothetical protein [Aureibacter tunicatorum]MDR6240082.1 hypothetical protein [Aureibacter tunicatorum]BDD04553.1 hypothetical protein AUTU_20360 [Aureibacter tunicatorum]